MKTKKLTPLDSKPRGIIDIQRGKHLTGQAIIFGLTVLLLLGIVGIKFTGIGAGGLETAEAQAQEFKTIWVNPANAGLEDGLSKATGYNIQIFKDINLTNAA